MDGVLRDEKPLDGWIGAMSLCSRTPGWLITRVLCDEASHTTLAIAGPFYHILPIPTRTVGACTHGRWAERHQGGGGVSGQKSNAQKSMPSLSLMQKGRKRPICSTQRWRLSAWWESGQQSFPFQTTAWKMHKDELLLLIIMLRCLCAYLAWPASACAHWQWLSANVMTIGDSHIKVSAHFRTCYHILNNKWGPFFPLHIFPS